MNKYAIKADSNDYMEQLEKNKEKEKIITESFKAFFRHNGQKETIINLPKINKLQILNAPYKTEGKDA